MRRYCCSCGGEDVGVDETKFLAYLGEKGLIYCIILYAKAHRRTLATTQIINIMFSTNRQSIIEYPLGHSARILNFLHHTGINLFPKAWHCRHASRIGLTHRLLHAFRIIVDDESCSDRNRQYGPCLLKDMGKRKEIEHAVFFTDIHAFRVCCQGGMILSIGKHHSLAIACRPTGI